MALFTYSVWSELPNNWILDHTPKPVSLFVRHLSEGKQTRVWYSSHKNRLKVSQLYNKVLGFSKHISTHRKSPSIWRAGVLQGCNAGKRAQKPTASEGIRDSHSRFASSVGMRAPGTCSRCPGSLPAGARPPPPAAPGKRRRLSGSVPDREWARPGTGHCQPRTPATSRTGV